MPHFIDSFVNCWKQSALCKYLCTVTPPVLGNTHTHNYKNKNKKTKDFIAIFFTRYRNCFSGSETPVRQTQTQNNKAHQRLRFYEFCKFSADLASVKAPPANPQTVSHTRKQWIRPNNLSTHVIHVGQGKISLTYADMYFTFFVVVFMQTRFFAGLIALTSNNCPSVSSLLQQRREPLKIRILVCWALLKSVHVSYALIFCFPNVGSQIRYSV